MASACIFFKVLSHRVWEVASNYAVGFHPLFEVGLVAPSVDFIQRCIHVKGLHSVRFRLRLASEGVNVLGRRQRAVDVGQVQRLVPVVQHRAFCKPPILLFPRLRPLEERTCHNFAQVTVEKDFSLLCCLALALVVQFVVSRCICRLTPLLKLVSYVGIEALLKPHFGVDPVLPVIVRGVGEQEACDLPLFYMSLICKCHLYWMGLCVSLYQEFQRLSGKHCKHDADGIAVIDWRERPVPTLDISKSTIIRRRAVSLF
mmetsp:Transcript_7844/g.15026  ORF Transcript_7844/g.15026 Transcript_7844/m.15026 type:complete len:258 (-) Transcript_7844:10443-11216(-)